VLVTDICELALSSPLPPTGKVDIGTMCCAGTEGVCAGSVSGACIDTYGVGADIQDKDIRGVGSVVGGMGLSVDGVDAAPWSLT
jgi:hypothetical protein